MPINTSLIFLLFITFVFANLPPAYMAGNNSPESELQTKHMATRIKTSSSNAYNLTVLTATCEVNDVLKMISPRWKMQVLFHISKGINQFSRLKEVFPSLSDQILGKRLCELVTEGLAVKEMIAGTVPQQTIYTHTPKGADLLKIIQQLHDWGQANKQ